MKWEAAPAGAVFFFVGSRRLDLINATDSRYQLQDGNGPGGGLPQWAPAGRSMRA